MVTLTLEQKRKNCNCRECEGYGNKICFDCRNGLHHCSAKCPKCKNNLTVSIMWYYGTETLVGFCSVHNEHFPLDKEGNIRHG